jgi:hypothetical protein
MPCLHLLRRNFDPSSTAAYWSAALYAFVANRVVTTGSCRSLVSAGFGVPRVPADGRLGQAQARHKQYG